ncbi:hypothetical protein TNCV_794001 [Trichonephila clavipes]|nr:hypothetical protein TNCV_794001 [Trichonephila clavipes]
MHWRHRFPCCLLSCRTIYRNRKRRPDTESGDRAGHSIRSKTVILQILLNNPSSVSRALTSIRMKSLPIAAAYGRTYGSRISSRYLRPVTVPPWNTCRSVWPPSEIPAQTRIPPPL